MSHTVTFTFYDSENRETPSQDTSPYDEGAVHDSFHQLIQEQSLLAEQVEMRDLGSSSRENLTHVVSSAHRTKAWEAPKQAEEHMDFSSATLRILASMPSRTIGRNRGAIISQYCNRTARLRRRGSRAPLQEVSRSARPSLRQLGLELDSGQEEEDGYSCLTTKASAETLKLDNISSKTTSTLCPSQLEPKNLVQCALKPATTAPSSVVPLDKRVLIGKSQDSSQHAQGRPLFGYPRTNMALFTAPNASAYTTCIQALSPEIDSAHNINTAKLLTLADNEGQSSELQRRKIASRERPWQCDLAPNAWSFQSPRAASVSGPGDLFENDPHFANALKGYGSFLAIKLFTNKGQFIIINAYLPPNPDLIIPKRSMLVKELQNLPAGQRINMLKAMPLSLAEKCKLRQDSSGHSGTLRKPKSTTFLSHCSWLKYYIIIGFRSLWYSLSSVLHTLQPWHYSLKQISGRFGSSILSYFLFLKTLLMFNSFLLLLLLVFVVAIQAAYPSATPNSVAFTGLEPLTGAGNFTHTLMYYGYYSNFTLNDPCAFSNNSTHCRQSGRVYLPYNMPLAYVFVMGVAFFVTCVLLVYSMSRSFGESYRVDSASGYLAVKVFCAWDYKVIQKRCIQLQSENICTHLKASVELLGGIQAWDIKHLSLECLAERRSRSHPLNLWKRLQKQMILFLAWTMSLSTVLGCSIAVHYFSEYIHQLHHNRLTESNQTRNEALLLGLPLLVSLINLLVPYAYNLLAVWEKRESPVLDVYVAICRNLILKMVILGLLCYHWLSPKVTSSKIQCWESFVGQELYRLVVMDFIFTLLDTFFGEFIWRVILEKKLQSKKRPEFDIARNVLELIYGQTLTWLGVFFAPLLPVVQIFKLLLLFYIKKTSLMRNCQSPSKPWRASHMSTVFITLLCFPSFLGASVFLSYTIWSVKPSQTCGPFQTFDTIYDSGKTWVLKLEKSSPNLTWFTWTHQHLIQNTFFVFFISGILLAVIYLNIQVVKGQRRIISLLKEQIANVSADRGSAVLFGIFETVGGGRRQDVSHSEASCYIWEMRMKKMRLSSSPSVQDEA
ncbi:hypothetical protein lerEdw1_017751 [Lerista edwardsae]|nr:hypothetical protein lerEdw1_017751 [Lerista edwardsae]